MRTILALVGILLALPVQAVKIQRDDLDFNKFYLITGYPLLDWTSRALDYNWYPDYLVSLGQLTGINPTNRTNLLPSHYLVPLKPRAMDLTVATNREFALRADQIAASPELRIQYAATTLILGLAPGGIAGDKLGPNAVGAGKIATGAVGSTEVADASILPSDLNLTGFNTTFWKVAGNGGTTPGAHFLGTTDLQPLEFRVNNQRAMRMEPGPSGSVNIIGGWSSNSVAAGTLGATIGGGGIADFVGAAYTNLVSAHLGTIGGGGGNTIQGEAFAALIGGGANNTIGFNSAYATLGGGQANNLGQNSYASTLSGGERNLIGRNCRGATISGGSDHVMDSASGYSAIAGGFHHTCLGWYAAIPGGYRNIANGHYSLAAGTQAHADHQGAFVWADSTGPVMASSKINEFTARASGGVRFFTNPNMSSGVKLAPGGGSWSTLSDREAKEHFQAVNVRRILEQLAALPITTWNYRTQNDTIRHLGPTAQDFLAAFGLGEDSQSIATVDADGVALAAIQGVYRWAEDELHQKEARLQTQQQQIDALRNEMAELRRTFRNYQSGL